VLRYSGEASQQGRLLAHAEPSQAPGRRNRAVHQDPFDTFGTQARECAEGIDHTHRPDGRVLRGRCQQLGETSLAARQSLLPVGSDLAGRSGSHEVLPADIIVEGRDRHSDLVADSGGSGGMWRR
jgi:hypothetical protein